VIEADPYANAPVDTDMFGANWASLEALASQLRGDCTARKISAPANVVVEFKNRQIAAPPKR
jgi:hypothetical protein